MTGREILHVNTDDFYASVFRLGDPALRGRAVVVAGSSPRGMVLSASYEARGDGVRHGMTVSAARRLCRRAAFVSPDWDLFHRASGAIFGVLRRYSPVIECASLDEGYIDYTGCSALFGHVLDAGRRIKAEVHRETGLQVSLGIASNKLVSHVASRTAKCAHVVDVYPGYESSFLAPVPIHRFPPVGERRAPVLRELGIACVGDILLFPEEIFSHCFGSWGRRLYRGAMGDDALPVRSHPPPDTRFTVGETLEPDRVHRGFLEAVCYRLAERMGGRLRTECSLAGGVRLEVRFADGMEVRGRDVLPAPASDDLLLFEAAMRVFARLFSRRVRVRRLVLAAWRVEPEPFQLELFRSGDAAGKDRIRKLRDALDTLRSRFPEGVAPVFGRALHTAGTGRAGTGV